MRALEADGGNDMRHAIEHAMRTHPDAQHVVVLCDGDVSPFCLEGGLAALGDVPRPLTDSTESSFQPYSPTNWPSFRVRWPAVRFSFVALGEASDARAMQRMAAGEGRGPPGVFMELLK